MSYWHQRGTNPFKPLSRAASSVSCAFWRQGPSAEETQTWAHIVLLSFLQFFVVAQRSFFRNEKIGGAKLPLDVPEQAATTTEDEFSQLAAPHLVVCWRRSSRSAGAAGSIYRSGPASGRAVQLRCDCETRPSAQRRQKDNLVTKAWFGRKHFLIGRTCAA